MKRRPVRSIPASSSCAGASSVAEVFEYGGLSFEWDPAKAQRTLAKHGVDFKDAATSFADVRAAVAHDLHHSGLEDRWQQISLSANGRLLITGYTHREPRIRIISARPATRRERHEYFQDQRRGRRHHP
jgi:uncharacterized protein